MTVLLLQSKSNQMSAAFRVKVGRTVCGMFTFSTAAQIHSCRAPSSPRYSDKWYQVSTECMRIFNLLKSSGALFYFSINNTVYLLCGRRKIDRFPT